MKARCQRCQTIFELSSFGIHECPGCGREVEVKDPGLAPPLPPEPTPAFEPTPWERRGELGVFAALKGTVAQALTNPQTFFARTDWSKADGLWSLFFWISVVPQMIGAFVNWLVMNPREQIEQMRVLYTQMGQPELAESLARVESFIDVFAGPVGLVGILLFTPFAALLTLLLMSGGAHLVLLLLGRAQGGWNATFKVFVYASAPLVLTVIPSCGSAIALLWNAILQVVGLAPAHRTTVGMAIAAVVGMHLLFICVLCGVPSVLVTILATLG